MGQTVGVPSPKLYDCSCGVRPGSVREPTPVHLGVVYQCVSCTAVEARVLLSLLWPDAVWSWEAGRPVQCKREPNPQCAVLPGCCAVGGAIPTWSADRLCCLCPVLSKLGKFRSVRSPKKVTGPVSGSRKPTPPQSAYAKFSKELKNCCK